MPTVTTGTADANSRATADAATAYTQAVMQGPPPRAGAESAFYRTAAAEMEHSAHAALSPAATARLDAEMSAAETCPETTGTQAETARAQARADLLAWLNAQADAEAEAG